VSVPIKEDTFVKTALLPIIDVEVRLGATSEPMDAVVVAIAFAAILDMVAFVEFTLVETILPDVNAVLDAFVNRAELPTSVPILELLLTELRTVEFVAYTAIDVTLVAARSVPLTSKVY
jgi:hypothetical protein